MNKLKLINELKHLVEYQERYSRSIPVPANYKDSPDWGALERPIVPLYIEDEQSAVLHSELQAKLEEVKKVRLALIDRTIQVLTSKLTEVKS